MRPDDLVPHSGSTRCVSEGPGSRGPRRRVGLVCGVLLLIAGCSRSAAPSPGDTGKPEAGAEVPAVKGVRPQKRTMSLKIEQPGHVEAFESTPVFAKIAGYVGKVNVDIDDLVDDKQVLVEVDLPEMVEEVKQKAAAVDVAAAKVQLARESLKAAEARVETTKAAYERWEGQYKREDRLVREKVLDAQTSEETLNQFKASAAAHKESIAHRDLAKVSIDAAIANQREAEAEHKRLQALSDYAQIKAPYPCVVTWRNVHTGWFVQPPSGDKREPLLIVERRDKYRVVVEVPEADAALVRKGDSASFRVPKLMDRSFKGRVQRTTWSLDSKTHTLRAEMDWDKPDPSVRPGHYVNATITVEHPDVWAVPASAVVTQDGQSICFRVRDGKAVRTPVVVGIKSGGLVEVAGPEDWKESDQIVANPAGLKDGQAVRE
jgi:HlyD family secretion protein